MKIICGKEAVELRELYAEAFLDTQGERYHRYLKATTKDALAGFMWDCLPFSQEKKIVESERACVWQVERRVEIYVIWDVYAYGWGMLHPKPEVVPEYYDTPAVLCMSSKEFLTHYKEFPDDIYMFDNTLSWTAILTHEYYGKNERRICYYIEA